MWCDNLSIVLLSANPVLHARSKYIELDLYFVHEKVIQKVIDVRHVLRVIKQHIFLPKLYPIPSFLCLL